MAARALAAFESVWMEVTSPAHQQHMNMPMYCMCLAHTVGANCSFNTETPCALLFGQTEAKARDPVLIPKP